MSNVSTNIIAKVFLTNLIMQASTFVTGIISARLLQPAGRGDLATVMLWPTVLVLGLMGIQWSVAREVASHPEGEADLGFTAIYLALSLSLPVIIIGYFAIPYLLSQDKRHLIGITHFYLLWVPLQFVALNLLALDHGSLRWRNFNLGRLWFYIPNMFFLVLFWIFKIEQLAWFVTAYMGSTLIMLIFRLKLQRALIKRGQFKLRLAKHLLRQGFPFFCASVSIEASMKIDQILIITFLPSSMVGYYVAAFAFASVHVSLGAALRDTSFGVVANAPDTATQGRFLTKMFRQASLLYCVIGGAVVCLAPLMIPLLFGRSFSPAIKPAMLLALVTILNGQSNILIESLRGVGKPAVIVLANLSGAASVAIAAWFLLTPYGLMGMAGAAAIGAAIQLAILVTAVALLLNLPPSDFWGFRWVELTNLYGHLAGLLSGKKAVNEIQ
jgi:O-antigen/teichoic acid export membrane protein